MAYKFTDNSISGRFAMRLHRISNVAETTAWIALIDSLIKGLFGGSQQLLDRFAYFTYAKRVAGIATKTIELCAAINGNDVTLIQRLVIGNTMYDYFIDRSTDGGRKISSKRIRVSLESRNGSVISYKLFGHGVKLFRCNAGLNEFC